MDHCPVGHRVIRIDLDRLTLAGFRAAPIPFQEELLNGCRPLCFGEHGAGSEGSFSRLVRARLQGQRLGIAANGRLGVRVGNA